MTNETRSRFDLAAIRVQNNEDLRPYASIFLADWTEGDEHFDWVLEAPVAELVDWAEEIDRNCFQ